MPKLDNDGIKQLQPGDKINIEGRLYTGRSYTVLKNATILESTPLLFTIKDESGQEHEFSLDDILNNAYIEKIEHGGRKRRRTKKTTRRHRRKSHRRR